MVRAFRQVEGLDYTEVYAAVAHLEATRIFLTYASYMGFTIDVKTAFLYGEVKDEIYVDQPRVLLIRSIQLTYTGWTRLLWSSSSPSGMVCHFDDSSARTWVMQGAIDHTLFLKTVGKDLISVQIYVTTSFLVPPAMFYVLSLRR
ncbi:uncharacterized protein LOC143594332 [Bidens hawaiensis]|uniref:uncharacterized protein LOC143594332 n=1 Tax=Bidens hawaiensis TaxID=980011 RepID=UPI004049673E